MKRSLIALLLVFMTSACNAGYGPLQDYSEFVSARLADDNHTVVFTYHKYAYRPATGIRAFPDGGIPKYETDVNILGTYDVKTKKLDILRREKNVDWQHGSGLLTIQSTNGNYALIAQGGQLRGPFAMGTKHLLVEFKRGKIVELNWTESLPTGTVMRRRPISPRPTARWSS